MKNNTTKSLVVYYSIEGNTDFVAQIIGNQLKADILRLEPEKSITTIKPLKYFWGGKQVLTRTRPKLKKFTIDPQKYTNIVIGTPVWVGTFSPVLNSFFQNVPLNGKKIAIFCTHEGRPVRALQNMTRVLQSQNEIVSQTNFLRPLLNKEQVEKQAISWVKNLF